jgi:hypothetical protein
VAGAAAAANNVQRSAHSPSLSSCACLSSRLHTAHGVMMMAALLWRAWRRHALRRRIAHCRAYLPTDEEREAASAGYDFANPEAWLEKQKKAA